MGVWRLGAVSIITDEMEAVVPRHRANSQWQNADRAANNGIELVANQRLFFFARAAAESQRATERNEKLPTYNFSALACAQLPRAASLPRGDRFFHAPLAAGQRSGG